MNIILYIQSLFFRESWAEQVEIFSTKLALSSSRHILCKIRSLLLFPFPVWKSCQMYFSLPQYLISWRLRNPPLNYFGHDRDIGFPQNFISTYPHSRPCHSIIIPFLQSGNSCVGYGIYLCLFFLGIEIFVYNYVMDSERVLSQQHVLQFSYFGQNIFVCCFCGKPLWNILARIFWEADCMGSLYCRAR